MPIQLDVDHAQRLATTTYSGAVTDADLRRLLTEALGALPREGRYSVLTDMRDCDMTGLTAGAVRDFAEQLNALQLMGRNAICAPPGLQFGLSRMFGSLADGGGIEVGVFEDIAAARAWLGLGD